VSKHIGIHVVEKGSLRLIMAYLMSQYSYVSSKSDLVSYDQLAW
jgi:hypothetical protein